jgi:hypothetical protein
MYGHGTPWQTEATVAVYTESVKEAAADIVTLLRRETVAPEKLGG